MAGEPHRVVALVAAPQASFELGCAAAVFRDPPYRFSVCTERPGSLRTTEGFDMVVTSAASRRSASG
jgi:AraC family transcriptional activator FtrA